MKKIIFLLFSSILLVSCGASKVEQEARKTINGDWNLSSITFPGTSENLDVKLFNTATAECLRNSDWNFVSNNNTGSYTITNMNCSTGTHLFIWSVNEVNAATGNYDLLLKPTNADFKSTTGNTGFRINLTNVSETTMVWEQTVNFEGKPFTITMNFTKK